MPQIRPFRALRYVPDQVGDLGAVVAPPYDVLDAGRARAARSPGTAERRPARPPADEPGDADDDRYRRAARTLAAWRSDGTLHKDPAPVDLRLRADLPGPGHGRSSGPSAGSSRRLRLEPLEPGSGVLPHERTLAGPREDRYRLLRATGVNTSPVVGLYDDPTAGAARDPGDARGGARRRSTSATTTARATGCGSLPAGRTGRRRRSRSCSRSRAAQPVTIADGHHRYETALRYRDERRMTRSCEEDPAFDYLLMLFLETTAEPLTVLPTHRLVRGPRRRRRRSAARRRGRAVRRSRRRPRRSCSTAFGGRARARAARAGSGCGRATAARCSTARRAAFEPLLPAGWRRGPRGWTSSLLGAALERLAGIDRPRSPPAGGSRSRSRPRRRIAAVDDRARRRRCRVPPRADARSPRSRRSRADGEVMPQKSTYFYPEGPDRPRHQPARMVNRPMTLPPPDRRR